MSYKLEDVCCQIPYYHIILNHIKSTGMCTDVCTTVYGTRDLHIMSARTHERKSWISVLIPITKVWKTVDLIGQTSVIIRHICSELL